jgi:hypothetical protein
VFEGCRFWSLADCATGLHLSHLMWVGPWRGGSTVGRLVEASPECGVHSQQSPTSPSGISLAPVGTCDQERHRMRLDQPLPLSRALVSETVR